MSSEKLMILADQGKTTTTTVDKIPFPKLENSNWSIDVTLATNVEALVKIPRGIIHLHTENRVNNKREVNVLDFNEEELVKFYGLMEQIQEKLDKICTKTDK